MSKVLYLTDEDVKQREEDDRKEAVLNQKKSLINLNNNKARKIHENLHKKTHYKAATSLMMQDTKSMSLCDGSANVIINNLLMHT